MQRVRRSRRRGAQKRVRSGVGKKASRGGAGERRGVRGSRDQKAASKKGSDRLQGTQGSDRKVHAPPIVPEQNLHAGGVTYAQRYVLCGKPRCARWHGPYWYAYWKAKGKVHSKYVGLRLPDELRKSLK